MEYASTLSFAKGMDRKDPLKKARDQFHFPKHKGKPCLYFAGHSLGLMPKNAKKSIEEELECWAKTGVEGHFLTSKNHQPWMPYHEVLTDPTARLVGAKPNEVVVMNSLTTNLHLMMVSFYRPTPHRYKILMEAHPFPSDIYAVKSQLRFHGYNSHDGLVFLPENPTPEDILQTIHDEREELALVLLGNVNFLTGQAFDMKAITKAAHAAGAVAGFNLAHGAGNLNLQLHDWDVDFAVWCSYKYLNSGPGSIAGCFIHQKHVKDSSLPRLEGWWGQNKQKRFKMTSDFDPIPTAEAWQLSNPPIFQMAALRASMDIFDHYGMKAIGQKRDLLTGYLDYLLRRECADICEPITPKDPLQRGTQISVRLKTQHARNIEKQLKSHGAICDFREPDILRIAPVPLYTRFEDVFRLVELLRRFL